MTPPASSPRARLAILVLFASALTACAPTPEATPTPTPLFASEAEAFAAAEATYREYNDALNAVDPADADTFDSVLSHTTGEYEATDRKNLSTMHTEHLAVTGKSMVVGFHPLSASPDLTEVRARFCIDVSSVEIVDPDGASRVSPTRPAINVVDVTFAVQSDELFIAFAAASEEPSCD